MCALLVTSRLRQSPAYPSGPVQHACLLQVGVPRTGHAVLWKLTINGVLDHHQCQSEDVYSHQLTVATKLQYLRARTGAHKCSPATVKDFPLAASLAPLLTTSHPQARPLSATYESDVRRACHLSDVPRTLLPIHAPSHRKSSERPRLTPS